MKKTFLTALIALLLIGCRTTLEPGGAYAPTVISTNAAGVISTNQVVVGDKAFYLIDSAFGAAYSALDAAFTCERQNRAFLWSQSHDIKHGLDSMRPTATAIVKSYGMARTAYKANPTPSGLDLLATILAKLQQIQAAASTLTTNSLTSPK